MSTTLKDGSRKADHIKRTLDCANDLNRRFFTGWSTRTHTVSGLTYSRHYLRHDIPFSLIHDLAELAADPSREKKEYYHDRFLVVQRNPESQRRIQVMPFGILDYFGIRGAIRQIPNGLGRSSNNSLERTCYASRNVIFGLLLLNEAAKTICYEPYTYALADILKRMTSILTNYFIKHSPIGTCSGITLDREIVDSISYFPLNAKTSVHYVYKILPRDEPDFKKAATRALETIIELDSEFNKLLLQHTTKAKEEFVSSFLRKGSGTGLSNRLCTTDRLNRVNETGRLMDLLSVSINHFKVLLENDMRYQGFMTKTHEGFDRSYEDTIIRIANLFSNDKGGEIPILYETVLQKAIKYTDRPSIFKGRCEYYYLRCFNFGAYNGRSDIW